MKKLLLSLFSVAAMSMTSFAIEPTTIEFVKGSTDYEKTSSYSSTWTSTDGMWSFTALNNNNNGWDFIAGGWKTDATTPTIATLKPSEAPITTIVATISTRYNKEQISSATLYVADNADFSGAAATDILADLPDYADTDMTIDVNAPEAGKYVKIVFEVPKQTANGQTISFSKITINYGEAGEVVEPDGTEANPYKIKSAADLCNAWTKVQTNIEGTTYFVQTADIDMAGVEDWHAINGFNGVYTSAINYDGQNHFIKNFSPKLTPADAAQNNYYMCTIFGVLTGTVKNLGVINADVVNRDGQGGGFLAAYAGHTAAAAIAPVTTIENVFVTGKYDAAGNANYIGGLVGTTGSDIIIKDCYVNAEIIGANNVAGFVGRLRNGAEIAHSYVAGSVTGTGSNVALVVASDKTPDLFVDGVVAFSEGAENAVVGAKLDGEVSVADAENEAELIEEVKSWDAFSATKTVYGLPGLESFAYEVIKLPTTKSVKETIALNSNLGVIIGYPLTVGFVNYSNVYACDEAGDFIQIYGTNSFKVGDVIPAGWEATYVLYNGNTPELKPVSLPAATEGTFEAKEVAAADINADLVNAVIVVKDVKFAEATPADKANFEGTVGDITLSFRNNYTLASVEAGTYDVTVVVTLFNGEPSLYVIGYKASETSGIEDIEAADEAEAVYYNLNGVRVDNPENGIFIVRRGDKVSKVVIR